MMKLKDIITGIKKKFIVKKVFLDNRILFFLGLIFVLFLNIYFRSYTFYLPQLKKIAQIKIEDQIYADAIKTIEQNFSYSSPKVKGALIREYVSEYKRTNKEKIKEAIKKEYAKLKDRFQDENNHTYMLELDCWHWARYVKLILEKGYPADAIENKRLVDKFMLYPDGTYVSWNRFLFYISSFLYKLVSLFRPIKLSYFLFSLPLFFVGIFIIVFYVLCAKHWGILSAVVGSIFIGLSPIFLFRSSAGWFDMDIFVVFFIFLIIFSYIKAISAKKLGNSLLWAILSSIFLVLFCFTWNGWWIALFIILGYELFILVNIFLTYFECKIDYRNLIRRHLFVFFVFFAISLFGILILFGKEPILNFVSEIHEKIFLNKPLAKYFWPNVYSTVSELRRPNFLEIVGNVGGGFSFFISIFAVLGLFLLFSARKNINEFNYNMVIISVVFTLISFFIVTRGSRFILFLIIPLGLSLAIFVSQILHYIRVKASILNFLYHLLIFVTLVILPMREAHQVALRIFPLMTDTWMQTLLYIKENTPQDSVINSWWDFGDWFKTVAERPVIFDGQSQNTPQAYWMAKVFLTDSEEEAVKILRMLNNKGNRVFEILNKKLNDPFKSIFILQNVLRLEYKKARKFLSKHLDLATSKEVLDSIFLPPKNNGYFLIDSSLMGKIQAVSFIGNWDFLKLYIRTKRTKSKKINFVKDLGEFGIRREIVERILEEYSFLDRASFEKWISTPLRFYSNFLEGQQKDDLILFPNGAIFDVAKNKLHIYLPNQGFTEIGNLAVYKDNKLIYESKNPIGTELAALVLIKEARSYLLLMDRKLLDSMFVKLFFLDGSDLKYFKLFYKNEDDGQSTKVYQIIW